MLGEKLGQSKGKVTGQRVLPSEGGPRMETAFRTAGTVVGVEITEFGTYTSGLTQGGAFYGEGQGIWMAKDGMCTWKGSGIGRPTGRGNGISYRGCIYLLGATGSLSRLDNMCAVYEYETDENDNTRADIWEWK